MGGEPDQVKWRGVQPVAGIRGVWPARNAERIYKEATQTGVGNTIIYTVPSDKVFFMSVEGFAAYNTTGAGNSAGIGVFDDFDAHQYYVSFHYFSHQDEASDQHLFFPAIEVPAGWALYVASNHANIIVMGSVFGWLEDA